MLSANARPFEHPTATFYHARANMNQQHYDSIRGLTVPARLNSITRCTKHIPSHSQFSSQAKWHCSGHTWSLARSSLIRHSKRRHALRLSGWGASWSAPWCPARGVRRARRGVRPGAECDSSATTRQRTPAGPCSRPCGTCLREREAEGRRRQAGQVVRA